MNIDEELGSVGKEIDVILATYGLDIVGAMGVTAMLGGTFAPGAIAIARRAELAAPDEIGLLEEET